MRSAFSRTFFSAAMVLLMAMALGLGSVLLVQMGRRQEVRRVSSSGLMSHSAFAAASPFRFRLSRT